MDQKYIDDIRLILKQKTGLSADNLKELSDDAYSLAGTTFKSISSALKDTPKTANEVQDMFSYASPEGLESILPPDSEEKSELDLDKALSTTPESFGLSPDDVQPGEKWLQKREAKQQKALTDQPLINGNM